MAIRLIDPLSDPTWDAFVASHPDGSFFQTSAWARLLIDSYGFKPVYCAAFDADKIIAAIPFMEVRDLLRRKTGVSLPFSDHCQPLYDNEAAFNALFNFAVETAETNKWQSLIIYGNAPFKENIQNFSYYYRHLLRLAGDEKTLFGNFRKNTRRNIKRAIKENVEVSFETSFNAIEEFYRLNCLTRKRHGLPSQPMFFFKNIYNTIISQGHGLVALGRYNGNPIAASIFLHFGKKAFFKYGASDKRYNNTCANYLVMWEAIRRYRAHGYNTFCFGKTEVQHKGLLQFKTGWGAEQQVINTYRYNVRKRTFVRSSLKTAGVFKIVIRRLPMPVLKIISLLIYKYMG